MPPGITICPQLPPVPLNTLEVVEYRGLVGRTPILGDSTWNSL